MLYFTRFITPLNNRNTHNELPDAVLVTGYKETGNQQYLVALFQRYSGLLFGVCFKYLNTADDARDACTDIYEELLTKLLRHDVENFKGWLHVLAKNHCLQKLRSTKKITTGSFSDDIVQYGENMHLEDVMRREANFIVMEKCLEELSAEQKQMVKLFYLEGKCYNEITETTGMGWNNVRSHIQNGRRNLKNCIEKTEIE